MAYEPQEWVDGPEGETPVTADALNHIEQGIADAASALDALLQRVANLEDELPG